MPYDILQLNDMLIPELIDVADSLKIRNAASLDKKSLVDKILELQAGTEEQPNKKRGRKPKEDVAIAAAPASPLRRHSSCIMFAPNAEIISYPMRRQICIVVLTRRCSRILSCAPSDLYCCSQLQELFSCRI